MLKNAIVVDNLSKRYLIGHRLASSETRHKYTALRDVIGREISNFARKTADFARGRQVVQGDDIEEFWALKNVNFEVKQGEVLGIIGRNGAGKSTLLKILSRITEPTEGRVLLRGRVSSLLEVGTGFHPELTGRENIFLNGAILGMTQREIRGKFDEIVAFAEVEKFLDTPVKHYSSGMYVRLAFAVAAHLEPEILIVDEVLAVGDADFQKKCLGKLDDVSRRHGRTVLLVSHNLAALGELTQRSLLFDSGRLVAEGPTTEIVSAYLFRGDGTTSKYTRLSDLRTSAPHIGRAEIITSEENSIHKFGQPFEVRINVKHELPVAGACLALQIVNQFQQCVIYAWAYYPDVKFGNQAGESILTCRFPSLRLNVGRYHLLIHLSGPPPQGEIYEKLDGICQFEVIRTDKTIFWGWSPEHCTYHEQWEWSKTNFDRQ
jgi:lipopolysaccharide transport system ATP-binding protein